MTNRILCSLFLAVVLAVAAKADPVYSINVTVPSDRTKLGTLELLGPGGSVLAGPFWIYAKADNKTAKTNGNATRSPTQPYGDTPTGTFNITALSPSGPGTAYSDAGKFGPNGVFKLDPTGGQAATAKANGRTGLLIHGGDLRPSPLVNGMTLRPTNGCIRMSNDDLLALAGAIQSNATAYPIALEVVEGNPSGTPTFIAGADESYDEGDPPSA